MDEMYQDQKDIWDATRIPEALTAEQVKEMGPAEGLVFISGVQYALDAMIRSLNWVDFMQGFIHKRATVILNSVKERPEDAKVPSDSEDS